MAHTYQSVTSPTTDYTAVSNARDWEKEDTLTWDRINEDYDTWNELFDYGKIHWCDWYLKVSLDIYTSLTTPDYTYSEVTS